jgi:hypothetical protein
MFTTTHGVAHVQDGKVVIAFGYLDEDRVLHRITLDVDAYAIALARDLCAAIGSQPCCTYRDHETGECFCPDHPQSRLHPLGEPLTHRED